MNVSLTPELERLVTEKVEAGLYESPSDMVAKGLALLLKTEDAKAAAREKLDQMIQVGLDQIERGEVIDGEESRARMMERFAARPPKLPHRLHHQ